MAPRETASRPAVSLLLGLLLLLLQPGPAAASFSLDTAATDLWYYTAAHLAGTTSPACRAAYAAPLDCDRTLLGMVAMPPSSDPGPADLARTCTAACRDSLDAYVAGLRDACHYDEDGDAALVASLERPRPKVPVAVVGEVFRYQYAWACSQNATGWCWLNYPSGSDWAVADFPCADSCALQFFADAHDYPGSKYWFQVYDLAAKSGWWKSVWTEGWETVQKCRGSSSGSSSSSSTASSSSSSASGVVGGATSTVTAAAGAASTTGADAGQSAAATTASGGASASASASGGVATSGAGRLRSPFGRLW
ncbi:hypothetical protein GGR56DRAFT_665822 [Xylariaceae sp. FL0804]|nr:hypothetical protein GGR56DRAFT_665822 [Xylariaceae sp. FL0804]